MFVGKQGSAKWFSLFIVKRRKRGPASVNKAFDKLKRHIHCIGRAEERGTLR